MTPKTIVGLVIGLFAFIALLIINPFVKVGAGERGVVLEWGAVTDRVLDEGIHWVMPIKDKVVKMDVTIQKEDETATASSKDLQNVTSNISINYRLDSSHVHTLYQELKKEYSGRVIDPAIQEFIKKTTANYTAEELITRRDEVKNDIRTALTDNLAKNHIIVEDVFITDFQFSKSFNNAIEAKVTAEQKALEAKNKLEQVKFEAEQKVATAEAEAEAIRIQAQAITQQGGKDFVQLRAIEKWNGQLPQQFVPGSAVPFLSL